MTKLLFLNKCVKKKHTQRWCGTYNWCMRKIAVESRACQIKFTHWMNVEANVTVFAIREGFA